MPNPRLLILLSACLPLLSCNPHQCAVDTECGPGPYVCLQGYCRYYPPDASPPTYDAGLDAPDLFEPADGPIMDQPPGDGPPTMDLAPDRGPDLTPDLPADRNIEDQGPDGPPLPVCIVGLDPRCPCGEGVSGICFPADLAMLNVGACLPGVAICCEGFLLACEGAVLPQDEVCGNGVDDDCNGMVDEGCSCEPGEEASCGSPTCPGTRPCLTEGYLGPCRARPPSPELCDGQTDEDCDGTIDEGCPLPDERNIAVTLAPTPETLLAADLDGDGTDEILWAEGSAIMVARLDGSILPGWPVGLPFEPLWLAAGDTDGDSTMEVAASGDGGVALLSLQGTILPGWPLTLTGPASLALGDLNGHGRSDIVVAADHQALALDGQGAPLPGFPVALELESLGLLAPAVGDTNGDGLAEVALAGQYYLTLLDAHGQVVPGWPVYLPSTRPMAGRVLTLVDMDGDGKRDVALHPAWVSGIAGLSGQGLALPRWPLMAPRPTGPGPLGAGDISGDGYADLAMLLEDGGVAMVNGGGCPLPGWPAQGQVSQTPPLLADLEGDGETEVLVARGSTLEAYEPDGASRFTVLLPGSATALVLAGSAEGNMLMVAAYGVEGGGGITLIPLRGPSGPAPWPQAGQNAQGTACAP